MVRARQQVARDDGIDRGRYARFGSVDTQNLGQSKTSSWCYLELGLLNLGVFGAFGGMRRYSRDPPCQSVAGVVTIHVGEIIPRPLEALYVHRS